MKKRSAADYLAWLKKKKNQFNRKGIILMYHRIVDVDCDPWWLCVSPSRFEEQVQVLKKYARPVQMRHMGKNIARFRFGPKEIVLTFDDGYVDNFQYARPILEKHGVPGTFFITTGAIKHRKEFWWDEVGRIILAAKSIPSLFEMTIAGTKYRWQVNLSDPEQISEDQAIIGILPNDSKVSRMRLHYLLWEILSKLSLDEKDSTLARIAQWAGQSSTPRPENLVMTEKELRTLAGSALFEIGAHTVRHPMLSRLSSKEQEAEIGQSKKDLEDLLGQTISSFCYPHGDYSKETEGILKKLNFKQACTIGQPKAVERNCNPYFLPRYGMININGDEFERNLKIWLS